MSILFSHPHTTLGNVHVAARRLATVNSEPLLLPQSGFTDT